MPDETDPRDPELRETVGDSGAVARDASFPSGGTIGPYRLIECIGEGGMGQVWLAEQEAPVRRQVALKLIRPGMDSRTVVARFEAERQALALMDHPAIAKVFDAGATPEGRLYFVMEYVKGEPITTYCDRRKLGNDERLRLFMLVCDGVQHAHQKGIIHRDIKPSNVLVTVQGDRVVPKIIDFGVAKAIAQRLTERTLFTELGALIGTPEYMSPEQAELSGLDVDTRTDVYALGVVLYELLTGVLPFDPRELRRGGFDEIRRRIREVDPPRPSARLSTLGADSTGVAENRRLDTPQLLKRLKGDLDWITMKALEKDRTRRYGTPNEMAADIGRHLNDEPVAAGPPGTAYRAKKFVRRHRLGVGAASLVAIGLAVLSVTLAVQARRISRERDRAEQVTAFLTDLFTDSSPNEARGETVTAREILDRGVQKIETQLNGDPVVQAQLMGTMGDVYRTLGLCKDSVRLLQIAVEKQSAALGAEDSQTLGAMNRLGAALTCAGRPVEAVPVLEKSAAACKRTRGENDTLALDASYQLGSALQAAGRADEAQAAYLGVIDTLERAGKGNDPFCLSVRGDLASLTAVQDPAKAVPIVRDLVARLRASVGDDHPMTLVQFANLTADLAESGDAAAALPIAEDTLPRMRRVLGDESPATMNMTYTLIKLYEGARRSEDGAVLCQSLIDTRTRVKGPDDPYVLEAIRLLAGARKQQQRYPEAERLRLDLLERKRRLLGDRDPGVVGLYYNVACVQALEGKRDEAFENLARSIEFGFRDADGMLGDTDLESLHADRRFDPLVAKARRNGQ